MSAVKWLGEGSLFAFGADSRLPAPFSALVNGTAAHALDFDDNFAPALIHATAVLAPALFALAQEEQLSGRAVADTYIVGLEIQARIRHFMQPSHYQRGWHSTSTIGMIGAAVACAKLLGCDANGVLSAISIATCMASGSRVQFGTSMKPVHAGLAAKNAVIAARMAQAGMSGNVSPFGGDWGISSLFGGNPDQTIFLDAAAGLGETLAIDKYGLLAKRLACCGGSIALWMALKYSGVTMRLKPAKLIALKPICLKWHSVIYVMIIPKTKWKHASAHPIVSLGCWFPAH